MIRVFLQFVYESVQFVYESVQFVYESVQFVREFAFSGAKGATMGA